MNRGLLAAIACVLSAIAPSSFSLAADGKTGVPYPGDIHYGKTGNAVVFSHRAHVTDFGLPCDDCHTKLFELKYGSAEASGDFTMESLNSGKYCGACHDGKTAFSTDDYSRCDACHSGSSGEPGVEGVDPVVGPRQDIALGSDDSVAIFKHSAHDPIACSQCHTALFPMKDTKTITTMDDMNAGKSCGSCHDGKKAFEPSDCGKCHPKM